MNKIEVVDKAIELVKGGWGRDRFVQKIDGKLCFCVRGAILAAAGATVVVDDDLAMLGFVDGLSAAQRLHDEIVLDLLPILNITAAVEQTAPGAVSWWNDYKATQQDVVDALTRYRATLVDAV